MKCTRTKSEQEFVDELVLTRTLKEELMSVFKEEAQIMADLEACEKELEEAGADMDAMQVHQCSCVCAWLPHFLAYIQPCARALP